MLKNCEGCKIEFEAKKQWAKFCSKYCGNKARMERYWTKKLSKPTPTVAPDMTEVKLD